MKSALYDRIGVGYAQRRRADARIAAQIGKALGTCQRVLNVGAGAGSYEPTDRFVVAVEPSAEMIGQRPRSAAPAVRASAGALPFRDRAFDAALAVLTVHHWSDRKDGLAEMQRVSRGRVVIFTWDPEHSGFWLVRDYFPEIPEIDRATFPSIGEIEEAVGPAEVHVVPIAADCTDGFLGAYWRRPAEYLDPQARSAMSAFARFDPTTGLARLRRDLDDGSWLDRNRGLEALSALDVGYRLVIAQCT